MGGLTVANDTGVANCFVDVSFRGNGMSKFGGMESYHSHLLSIISSFFKSTNG